MVIGLTLAINIHRIIRYLETKIKLGNEQMKAFREQEKSLEQPLDSFFA